MPTATIVRRSLVDQVIEGVRGLVDTDHAPGDRLPPEPALMARFGVGRSTIREAVRQLQSNGLLRVEQGRGTFVAQRRSTALNLAVTFDGTYRPSDPYLKWFLEGFNKAIAIEHAHAQFFPLREPRIFDDGHSLLQELLRERRLDGVVASDPLPPSDVDQLQNQGIPVVALQHDYPGTNCIAVLSDDRSGARQIAEHLVGLGHRRVLLVVGPEIGISARRLRSSGVLAEALLHEFRVRGLEISPSAIVQCNSHCTWDTVAAAVRQRLTAADRPTAVLAISDLHVLRIIELAQELGLRVPQDLSVAGYGDVLDGASLTSVRIPFEEMGCKIGELLFRAIRREPTESVTFPVQLTKGVTTGARPT